MYREVWACSTPGSKTRERLKRYVAHHRQRQIFTAAALAAMEQAVSGDAAPAAQPAGRVDPRQRKPAATPLQPPQPSAHARPQQHAPPAAPEYTTPSYGVPPAPHVAQWGMGRPPMRAGGMPGPPPGFAAHHSHMPPDPLAQYRATQQERRPPPPAGAYGAPAVPQPMHVKPLSTTFQGVRLQVRKSAVRACRESFLHATRCLKVSSCASDAIVLDNERCDEGCSIALDCGSANAQVPGCAAQMVSRGADDCTAVATVLQSAETGSAISTAACGSQLHRVERFGDSLCCKHVEQLRAASVELGDGDGLLVSLRADARDTSLLPHDLARARSRGHTR